MTHEEPFAECLCAYPAALSALCAPRNSPSSSTLWRMPRRITALKKVRLCWKSVFPRVISSDCAILRFEDQVMMIDSSTRSEKMNNRIQTACQTIGVDHIDVAYNSHPHNDHIDGFPDINEQMPIGKLITTFPSDFDFHIKQVTDYMNEHDIPVERVYDGDVMTLGESDAVTLTVIQELRESWPLNDQ